MTMVLVTGGGGQLGRSIADRRAEHPHLDLVFVDRDDCDITDPTSIAAAFARHEPAVVVNTAAYTAVDAAETDEDAAFAANAEAVGALAAACQAGGARLVQISTDYVFDGTKDGWYVESDPIAPLGVYGRSKAAGETAARTCTDHLILRTAWVYASHGHNFVKTMLRLARDRDTVRVVADQHGCPSSAHDLADAILRLADHDLRGTYHLAGTDEATWHEFAVAVFDCADASVTVEPIGTVDYPTPAPRPANSRLDSTALTTATGLTVPGWRTSLAGVVDAILATDHLRT